jgi:hypothetical protein
MNDEHAVFEGNSLGNLANHGLVAESNGWIFFHNCANGCSLEKRQANSKKSVKLDNVTLAYSINVKEGWIYFYTTQPGSKSSNPWAGGKIHKIRIDGSDQQMLVDTRAVFLNLRGEWIYYIDLTDGYIHKIRIDGLDKQVVVKM